MLYVSIDMNGRGMGVPAIPGQSRFIEPTPKFSMNVCLKNFRPYSSRAFVSLLKNRYTSL